MFIVKKLNAFVIVSKNSFYLKEKNQISKTYNYGYQQEHKNATFRKY